jgi:hypothetical protein
MSYHPPADARIELETLGVEPGMPGLTAIAGAFLAEAAAVCFQECGHEEEFELHITGSSEHFCRVHRSNVGIQTIRTHADLTEATEQGACGVAILITRDILGAKVLERSAKGTGFDYWIGEDDSLPFRLRARLEVSGILRGTMAEVERRADQKCRQTERSDATRLDALVFIVEFSQPIARVIMR